MPVKFWNDHDESKIKSAYFERYNNIWHHADYIQKTKNNGYIIYGRSDATLKPGGVRIGTAEIYRQVESFEEISEALVVGQNYNDDVRIVLFVKLKDQLTEKIERHISWMSQFSGDEIQRVVGDYKNIIDFASKNSGEGDWSDLLDETYRLDKIRNENVNAAFPELEDHFYV